MGALGDEPALSVRRERSRRPAKLCEISTARCARICLADDPWATRPAVGLLCSGFTAIEPDILTVTPAEVGAARIGHFGFFRPDHRDTLWRGAAEWLEAET